MGNVPISCCRSKSPRSSQDFRNGDLGGIHENKYSSSGEQRRKLSEKLSKQNDFGDNSSSYIHQRTPSILQHISEREPDDSDTDPPLNSLNKPILASGVRRKASSCSTIFIDNSTISQPDIDQTIRCVSLAIYQHIKNRTSDNSSGIFDESIHPLRMPTSSSTTTSMHDKQDQLIILDNQTEKSSRKLDEPDQETIYNFVSTLFKAAELTSEYAITTLVYLERLMTYVEIDLTPNSWRRMFLGALLLSSKVWEDHAVWNVDYAQILEEISVDDINELERQFLEMIQFNMNVPSSVYAKYYFHLRTLALRNGFSENQTLLTINKARDLEAKSNMYAADDWLVSPIHRKTSPTVKRHTSLEKLEQCGQTKAILM